MFTENEYQDIKTKFLDTMISGTKVAGGLPPHITLFGVPKDPIDGEKNALVYLPLKDEDMVSEEAKEIFVKAKLPAIAQKVKEKFTVYALAYCSEAWLREVKPTDKIPDDYRDLPVKKEVIFVNIERPDKTDSLIYEMKRSGHKVTPDGKLVSDLDIVLVDEQLEATSLGGRFTGLIKHFI